MLIEKEIIQALIKEKAVDRADFRRVVASVYRNHNTKGYHTNIRLREFYDQMVLSGEVQSVPEIEKLLMTKRLRSASGVSVITVLTKPYDCPGKCIYCPTEKDVPKSYLSNEPAVMRAILADYDPKKQVQTRLKSLKKQGHPVEKIEIIVIGGTFSYLPRDYQEEFIKDCFDGLNGSSATDLAEAQLRNEKSQHRCVGLTLETRPDYIDEAEVIWFRYLGATRVELGVQSVFDDVLLANCRGHKVSETVAATALLKTAGFKICYHMMPNLYKSSLERDLEMFETIFEDERFKPDYIKIYPTMVTAGTALETLWKKGEYQSYSDEELVDLICQIKGTVPFWMRIMRTIRDIPGTEIISGSKSSNLRQVILEKLKDEGRECRCIRCREIGLRAQGTEKAVLFVEEYQASGGREYFLSFESPDRKTLYSLLRLRLNDEKASKPLVKTLGLEGCAIIREVHTYGQEVSVGDQGKVQHSGYGRKLIAEAEKIAHKNGFKKIAVIAGIGAREYYRKFGYKNSGSYLIKNIDKIT